jgi:hypothetical protein
VDGGVAAPARDALGLGGGARSDLGGGRPRLPSRRRRGRKRTQAADRVRPRFRFAATPASTSSCARPRRSPAGAEVLLTSA